MKKKIKIFQKKKLLNNNLIKKKHGLTIYCNDKYNLSKLYRNKKEKEKEKDEKSQNNQIETKSLINKKTFIQNFKTIKNQDLNKKKFHIRNFNSDFEHNSKTNIINSNK